jgi:glucan phosphorylase
MEFLWGASKKFALYPPLTDDFAEALSDYGIKLENLNDCEPDAGLQRWLGRLAPVTLTGFNPGYPATGLFNIYEYGIFRQKLLTVGRLRCRLLAPRGEVGLCPVKIMSTMSTLKACP